MEARAADGLEFARRSAYSMIYQHAAGEMRTIGVLIVGVALFGCSERVGIEPGRYAYTAQHAIPGGQGDIVLEGTLIISSASADAVEGSWDVPRLQPRLLGGGRQGGTYEVLAKPVYGGTLVHNIAPSETGLSCTGEFIWIAAGGDQESVRLTCSLSAGDTIPTGPIAQPNSPAVISADSPGSTTN